MIADLGFTSIIDATTNVANLVESSSLLWIIVVGFVVAFVLAFAVGANDVANSFGSAVGSKVLTLKQACILATIFETLGAVLIGSKVGKTIRKGIVDPGVYTNMENGTELLMLGFLSSMLGSAIWQLIATVFKLPVSGTHSIVGACIGFSMVVTGTKGVNWIKLLQIVGSWFLSPVLSGMASTALFWIIKRTINNQKHQLKYSKIMLPLFYSFTIALNTFSIIYSGASTIGLGDINMSTIIIISLSCGLLIFFCVYFFYVPRIVESVIFIRKVEEVKLMEIGNCNTNKPGDSGYETPVNKNDVLLTIGKDFSKTVNKRLQANVNIDENEIGTLATEVIAKDTISTQNKFQDLVICDGNETFVKLQQEEVSCIGKQDDEGIEESKTALTDSDGIKLAIEAAENEVINVASNNKVEDRLFSPLQILTACFASFAHGGNDVSNAIGPLIGMWLIFQEGFVGTSHQSTPWFLLMYGSAGICFGLWTLGRRVIETLGKNLTKLTPSSGFCIELMTAVTVIAASNLGLPVSTTHCKVGAVVFVGWSQSKKAVDWGIVKNIVVAWFVTVPVSGVFSAFSMWILMKCIGI